MQVLEYVLRVYDVDLDGLKTALRNGGHNELEAIMGTIAETLLEQGEARGLAKGEALGLSKGIATGKAETLIRLARKRFGDVPDARADMVLSADAATLDRWLDALVVAETLDEVFGPPNAVTDRRRFRDGSPQDPSVHPVKSRRARLGIRANPRKTAALHGGSSVRCQPMASFAPEMLSSQRGPR